MNEEPKQKKRSAVKVVAIVGFTGVIIAIAWLSIQLVSVVPGAFSSLASLAESLDDSSTTVKTNENTPAIIVTNDASLINSGGTVKLSWNKNKASGSYTFSYVCTEGVAVDMQLEDGDFQSIACGTKYNLGDITSLTILVESEKVRYEDINYTIAFLASPDSAPIASGTSSFMVINSSIPDQLFASNDTSEVVVVETVVEADTVIEPEPEVTKPEIKDPEPTTPAPVTKPTPTPTYQPEFTYEIPTSNPNGRTDLATKFISLGKINGNAFLPGVVKQNESGAIQFEVKNYGTKTSADWTFSLTLPNGSTYNSATQKPLKPNERALLTIGFSTESDSNHTFKVTATDPTDQTTINNHFEQAVTFSK